MSIILYNSREDKWENIQKYKLRFLIKTKWNGRTYSMDNFTGIHRSSFVTLQEVYDNVNFEIPTEHSRVGLLIDNISNNDPDLRASTNSVRIINNGMRDDFEKSATLQPPVCPYTKHRSTNNNNTRNPQISDVTLKDKSHIKTGLSIFCHTKKEYYKMY